MIEAYGEKLNAKKGQLSAIGLIAWEELEALGCGSGTCTTSSYPWTSSTSYWTSSLYDSDYAWYVDSLGNFGYRSVNDDDGCGARPLITISKSIIGI